MSCTQDFIKVNTHAGTSEAVATLQDAINKYDAGAQPICDGVTRGNSNAYSILSTQLASVNQMNGNLIGTCTTLSDTEQTATKLINNIEADINELSDDEKTARLRVELLRSKDTAITNHQVFLLGRPLRPASIPFLWALSVLFIGIAVLIFYMFNPFDLTPSNTILFQAYLFLRNPLFIGAALAVISITIILATLYKIGVL